MAWVYPTSIVSNEEWYPEPSSWEILDTLTMGDNEFAYTPAGIYPNLLSLTMPTLCNTLHIRARRGTGFLNNASLVVQVVNSQTAETTQYVIDLTNTPSWQDYYYTPSHTWDSVILEGESVNAPVGVSVLRGETAGLTTRRTLTGVGL